MCLQPAEPRCVVSVFNTIVQTTLTRKSFNHRRQKTCFSQDGSFLTEVHFCRKQVFMKSFLALVCFDVTLLPILWTSLKKIYKYLLWDFWAKRRMNGICQEHRMYSCHYFSFLCCHIVSSHARQIASRSEVECIQNVDYTSLQNRHVYQVITLI